MFKKRSITAKRSQMVAASVLLLLACALTSHIPSSARAMKRNVSNDLLIGDTRRFYNLHLPAIETTGLPLIVVLHGFLSGSKYVAWDTEMSKFADSKNFVVVYPKGVGASWNAGTCCGKAFLKDVDDVSFIKELVEKLISEYHLNPHKIYATGFSNGAMFCYRLGSELSDTFAAIAPVEGNMAMELKKPTSPISVMIVHGDKDHVFPVAGGTGKWLLERYPTSSLTDIANFWSAADGCGGENDSKSFDKYTRTLRTGGTGGTEVCVVDLKSGGHYWPSGRESRLLHRKANKDFATTGEVCDFLLHHPKAD